ncbi:MAG: DUF4286 family protein [Ginsengibacter sp.]
MFIYNTTIKIDNDIEDEWSKWIRETFITETINTGLFYDHRFFKLLDQDEREGKTFIIQFYSNDRRSCDDYTANQSKNFEKMMADKWGDKFIVFQSLLESVQ